MPISELVFGASTQNRSSLEPYLGFAAIAWHAALWIMHDTYKPLKREAGPQKVVAHQAARQCCAGPASCPQDQQQRHCRSQCAACRLRQIQEKTQDYSGFGLKPQTPTSKSAQLASRARARAEYPLARRRCVAKGAVREADSQIEIEHEETLANRLREIPRVNFAHGDGSCAL